MSIFEAYGKCRWSHFSWDFAFDCLDWDDSEVFEEYLRDVRFP
jgi:hypothetical protein